MAPQLYPPRFLDGRPNRQAEQRAFNALATQLPDSFLVIHDVMWSKRVRVQVDFVVAHPEIGILVIEVKGGKRIFCKNKEWFVERHDGKVAPYKCAPHEQADRAVWQLRELLERQTGDFPKQNIAWAVCFPDHDVRVEDLDACLDREVIIDRTDLDNLPAALQRICTFWQEDKALRIRGHVIVAEKWIAFLRQQLARDYDFKRLLGPILLAERKEIREKAEAYASAFFSEEQQIVLERASQLPRLGIAGCAGSGKTLLAMAIARQHAAKKRRVLLCCYNRPLCEELKRLMYDVRSRVKIVTFDELRDNIIVPGLNRPIGNVPLSERTARVLEQLQEEIVWSGQRYQAIVVDEGQDFDRDWWPLIERLLEDPGTTPLYVFFDDNQRLYARRSGIPADVLIVPLTKNFRTTKTIHDLIMRFYDGETRPISVGEQGRNPGFLTYNGSVDDLEYHLQTLLRNLRERQVQDCNIAILSARGTNQTMLRHLAPKLGLSDDLHSNSVCWTTIYQFKGLERSIVILVEIDPDVLDRHEIDQLLYVGYSRASERLVIIHHTNVQEERLRAKLARLEMSPGLLNGLNAEQQKVVLAPLGVSKIRAGAGTGKTRVLTRRIEYLLDYHRVNPHNIMAVTFTVKAAGEIRDRLRERFGLEIAHRITVGTFHSICSRILRSEIVHLDPPKFMGRASTFRIANGKHLNGLIRDIVAGHNKRRRRRDWLEEEEVEKFIDRHKQNGIAPSDVRIKTSDDMILRACYLAYDQALREGNFVDFDDLLILAVRLLGTYPDVLDRVRNRFLHVLVDEFQDTNQTQFDFIRLLTLGYAVASPPEPDRSLLVVGDAQQAIYSWRGAHYELFRDFDQHFPTTEQYDLIRNYRSSRWIIEIALQIAKPELTGVERLELVAARANAGAAPAVTLIEPTTMEEEAQEIAGRIRIALDSGKTQARDIAILIRAKHGSVAAEKTAEALSKALMEAKIPFVSRGLEPFYGNPMINGLVSYLRALLQPANDELLRDALDTKFFPDIGQRVIDGMIAACQRLGYSTLWDLLNARQENMLVAFAEPIRYADLGIPHLGEGRAQSLRDGVVMMDKMRTRLRESSDFDSFMRWVIAETPLRTYKNDKNADQFATLLEVFISIISEQLDSINDLPGALDSFAAYNSLFEHVDDDTLPGGRVNVMSIHAAKGLEFDIVIVPGLEEGMFPSDKDLRTREEQLEAGRLCYVAFTRPRHELILSCNPSRTPGRPRRTPFADAVRDLIEVQEVNELISLYARDERPRAALSPIDREEQGVTAILLSTVEDPLEDVELVSLDRLASEYPGDIPILILGRDASGTLFHEDTGYSIGCTQSGIRAIRNVFEARRRCDVVYDR
ncbi:hypothetical protein SE17_04825 [Kouleothrix aurantiaca]|uniref:DNA 3'-5' helicase n=1 Tax=Kouleothrix aurantiaca TaxID=186479 RepID=A0A0P9HHG6_9CHLR|nr:hypothetical protein SE17_04825 [Kouleothrix aurantiaca]